MCVCVCVCERECVRECVCVCVCVCVSVCECCIACMVVFSTCKFVAQVFTDCRTKVCLLLINFMQTLYGHDFRLLGPTLLLSCQFSV